LYLFEKHFTEASSAPQRWRNWHVSRHGHRSAGAQCYILPRTAGITLLNDKDFNTQCNGRVYSGDRIVSGCLFKLGLPCWFRVPGLVSHSLGRGNSAMGHTVPPDVAWQREATLYGI
jgi:hypothetical protein